MFFLQKRSSENNYASAPFVLHGGNDFESRIGFMSFALCWRFVPQPVLNAASRSIAAYPA